MRALSSRWTAFARRYLLRAWVIASTLSILAVVLRGSLGADPWKAVDLVFLVVFGMFLYRFTRALVDSVHDGGDHLFVTRDGQAERIPLEHIADVEAGYLINAGRVVLHLSPASRFGDEIAFVPRYAWSLTGFGTTPVARELLQRAHAARAESAA